MDKHIILVVDDHPQNIQIIAENLRDEYVVKAANNGAKALSIANDKARPDLILLDIMMPEMDGYEVCRQLKSMPFTSDIPVIFVTAMDSTHDEAKGLDLGAVDYITKPIRPEILKARIKTHLTLHDETLFLESKILERTQELEYTQIEIVSRLGRAAEFKDNETGMHVVRMSFYSKLIAEKLGIKGKWAELVFRASPMHDIGKIGIPDGILMKPDKLNNVEWDVMKTHPEIGAEILGGPSSDLLRMAREIALAHHEKWDGTGYPYGLAGEEIPLSARVVAIADVFDALTTARPYKKAWDVDKAFDLILSEKGKHFDPELVDVFMSLRSDVLNIREKYSEASSASHLQNQQA